MEKETITLSLDTYNRLRDFKLNHLSKYQRVRVDTKNGYFVIAMTNNEIIKSLQKELDDKTKQLDMLNKEHYNLLTSYSEVRAMTARQFRKWKNEH